MRRRVAEARVGRLATVTSEGRPHLVPFCFAVDGDRLYSAVDDAKPKSTLALRRLDHIRQHPAVSVLVDHYAEDWSTLWWIRLDGEAVVLEPGAAEHEVGLGLLVAKYEQYQAASAARLRDRRADRQLACAGPEPASMSPDLGAAGGCGDIDLAAPNPPHRCHRIRAPEPALVTSIGGRRELVGVRDASRVTVES